MITQTPTTCPPRRTDYDHLPCPRCDYRGPHTHGTGAGPHYGRLLCGQCSAYIRWLPKPRPLAAPEVQS
jgi:hypothetical protein